MRLMRLGQCYLASKVVTYSHGRPPDQPVSAFFLGISSARSFNENHGLLLLLLLEMDDLAHCEARSNRYVCYLLQFETIHIDSTHNL